jgi:hypothetical protein
MFKHKYIFMKIQISLNTRFFGVISVRVQLAEKVRGSEEVRAIKLGSL